MGRGVVVGGEEEFVDGWSKDSRMDGIVGDGRRVNRGLDESCFGGEGRRWVKRLRAAFFVLDDFWS